jgi:hypothetical protein
VATWATPEDARAIWPDAPTGTPAEDDLLDRLLAAAQEVCEAYAPALADVDPVPARYTEAVCQQARAIWSNFERDGDVIGFGDDFAVRVRPLEPSVKLLLRPQTGRPVLW